MPLKKFWNKTVIYRTGRSILGVAVFLVVFFAGSQITYAATSGTVTQTGTSTFKFTIPTGSTVTLASIVGSNGFKRYFKGTWPNGTNYSSTGTSGAYPNPLYYLSDGNSTTGACGNNAHTPTDRSTYFTCDMEVIDTGDGDYWVQLSSGALGITWQWYGMHRESGVWSLNVIVQPLDPSAIYQTRFLSDSTVTGVSSTTVTFNINYFLNLAEFQVGNRPDYISLNVLDTQGNQIDVKSAFILPLIQGTSTKSIVSSASYPDGDYIAYANFWNVQNNNITFNRTSAILRFTVAAGTVSAYTATVDTGLTELEPVEYEVCSVLDIGCYIKNAFKYLFYPTTTSIAGFLQLKDSLNQRIPFVYINQALSLKQQIYSSTASLPTVSIDTGALGTITFISQSQVESIPYASTIRSLIAAGMWITLLYGLYRMGLRIHDKETV